MSWSSLQASLEDSTSYRELYSASRAAGIPRTAKLVACHEKAAVEAADRFPAAVIVTVATHADEDADVLDARAVRLRDARGWLKRQVRRGTYRPTLFCTRRRKRALRVLTWRVPKDWWIQDRTGESHTLPGAAAVQYAHSRYFATSLVTDLQWPHRTPPLPYAVTAVTEPPPPPSPRPRPAVAPRLLDDAMQLNHGQHAETVMAMPGGATGIRLSSAVNGRFIVDFGTPDAARVVSVTFASGPVDIDLPRDHKGKRARQVKVVRASGDMDAEGSVAAI